MNPILMDFRIIEKTFEEPVISTRLSVLRRPGTSLAGGTIRVSVGSMDI
jgi:hypothetical protein